MKAYRFDTRTKLEPFGDPVSEAFLGGTTLGEAVERALSEAEVSVERVASSSEIPLGGDFLVLPDTLFLTRQAIRSFLATASGIDGTARLALPESALTDHALPLQQVERGGGTVAYDLFRIRRLEIPRGMDWAQLRVFLASRATPALLRPDLTVERQVQSRPGPPRSIRELPRSTLLAADVRHWVHLLWVNQLLPWIRLREYWEDHPGPRYTWLSRGGNPYDQARRLSVIGENCNIHPTAYVEGSILGDKVVINPFVVVRDSIIGSGVEIGSNNALIQCVVGDGCLTLNDSHFVGCTCYPESTLANIFIRNSVIGRKVFLTSAVMFWDEPIEAPVTVRQQGREVPTGRWLVGCCAGHGSILGTRAIFLPGRAVPNRAMIVMRPEEGVTKLPAKATKGEPYVYHQGTIVPLKQALPDWNPMEIEATREP